MSNVIEEINQLDFIFENPAIVKVQSVKRILQNTVIKAYLFQKLSREFNPEWFVLLYELNLFSPAAIPGPVILKGENGYGNEGGSRAGRAALFCGTHPDLMRPRQI